MKRGDFTNLADDYTKYRPSYNESVVKAILNSLLRNKCHKSGRCRGWCGIFTKYG